MAWEFERVAGPFEGPCGGVIWDCSRGQVLFSTVDEGRLLWFDHAIKSMSEFRRYANRVNGLALGPNGEIYGAQEGGRRLVEFTPTGAQSRSMRSLMASTTISRVTWLSTGSTASISPTPGRFQAQPQLSGI
jgi:hypothetical protein